MPQLYQQFNSSDNDEADRADEAWERSMRAYKQHLDVIRERTPSQVVKLSELCLHDAEILSRVEESQPMGPFFFADFPFPMPIWSAIAIVSVKLDGEILSLIYWLCDRIRVHQPPDDWSFSRRREHWLYDEVDFPPDRRGTFFHRVLLSTGIVLEIPFLSVVIHRFALLTSESD